MEGGKSFYVCMVMSYKIVSLLFIGLWMNNMQIKADIVDTLSVEVEESDWTGGLDIFVQTDSSNLSAVSSNIQNVKKVMVYNMAGHIVRRNVLQTEALKDLPKGIYVINRKKYVVNF